MKILFIGNTDSEFIKRDYEILRKHFDVDMFDIKYTSATAYIKRLRQIKKHVKRYDLIFSWFANWHSAVATFYAKKYGKKSVVVAGGYDVVYLPEINYGSFSKMSTRIPAKYALKNADLVLSVSRSNQKELLEKVEPKKNILVYNGVDTDKFYPKGQKENLVITVGAVNPMNWRRKGIELFVEVAQYFVLHDTKFIVVGKIAESMRETINKIYESGVFTNLVFTDFISDKELLNLYQKAKVYCQLSLHEGFGVSVAEAMACSCVPVVTNRGALPEVVDDAGFIIDYNSNISVYAKTIKKALETGEGKKARKRVVDNFSLQRREEELITAIQSIEENSLNKRISYVSDGIA